MSLQKQLIAYRKQHNLKQKDLAALLKVSLPAISYWERGGGMRRKNIQKVQTLLTTQDIPLSSFNSTRVELNPLLVSMTIAQLHDVGTTISNRLAQEWLKYTASPSAQEER